MTKKQHILDHIKANPGCTNKDLAAALGDTTNNTSAFTSIELKRGTLAREEVGKLPNGTPFYGFTLTGNTQLPRVRKPYTRRQPKQLGSIPKKRSNVFEETAAAIGVDTKTLDPMPRTHKRRAAALPEVTSIDGLIESLAAQLVSQVVSRVKQTLPGELQKLLPAPAQPPAEGSAPPITQSLAIEGDIIAPEKKMQRSILPNVAIIGLLPQQAGLISQEFGRVFDFDFIEPDAVFKLRRAAERAGTIIEMTKFISHSAEAIIKNGTQPLIRIHGGMSKLREELTRIYNQWKESQ